MDVNWQDPARRLAGRVTRPESRWWHAIAATPRHPFTPHWWERTTEGRTVRDGAADIDMWLETAYADRTVVTRIGPVHADHADPGHTVTTGRPTSSSTLPTLLVTMYRHAMLADGCRTLVTTGTGYGTALACHRLGADLVTSIDIDPYLVQAATDRLADLDLRPHTEVADITREIPGDLDRIVSTVAVPTVPSVWLEALRPGGRLVTVLAETGMVVIADKTADGGAQGHIAPDWASFMAARHGDDYDTPTPSEAVWKAADGDGETVSTSRYPLLFVPDSPDVRSMLHLEAPGIDHRSQHHPDGRYTIRLAHPDGSWARATAPGPRASPTVHQGGPRRLYDVLDGIRDRLNSHGSLPVFHSRVVITPDGETTLSRGTWSVTL